MPQTPTATPTRPSTQHKPRPEPAGDPKPLTPWNVVVLDDQEHTYEYVIDMLGRVFGHGRQKAYELARTIDTQGRAVVATVHRELGELKVAQIVGFGPDPLLATSTGPMRAFLEPAETGGDHDPGRDGPVRG